MVDIQIECFQSKSGELEYMWLCQLLTLFRLGLFGAAHGWGLKKGPLPKICHTYPTVHSYNLPKEDPKNI